MGTVSGAHLNPVVTIAFAIRRNFPWIRVSGYIIAQVARGWQAAIFLGFMFGNAAVAPGNDVAGPLSGALIGVLFEWTLKGSPTTAGTLAAQGTLDIDDKAEV